MGRHAASHSWDCDLGHNPLSPWDDRHDTIRVTSEVGPMCELFGIKMLSELAYTRRGQGEPLVLLHGIGHRHGAYDPVIDELAKDFDVIAADLPGLGDSPGLPEGVPYTTENVVRALAENFDRWGISRPHVVGNSLGGMFSIALAQLGHVRSATCLAPAGYFRPWNLLRAGGTLLPLKLGSYLPASALRQFSKLKFGRKFIGWSLYAHPERHDSASTFADSMAMKRGPGFWAYFVRCIPLGFSTPRVFRGVATVPITIAWGNKDRVLHPTQALLARKRLRGISFVGLLDCGHVPMADSPTQVVAAIRNTAAKASGQLNA